ncbi:transporter substrate-binding domain-containing protein [Vogesella sp. LIG4]|uniref:transporter substrate-binding domain-containing protein n=1 Tax=Vogesella sp. LIG4 TaxID=1192162 RepID=UPI00081FE60C|nr:transporter substrate-binding domain-containing protein [Vogesella sp. LIG4]SCK13264.1 polar amino acid transport system substrate-binding protein [Vogesella sp. LIG4]
MRLFFLLSLILLVPAPPAAAAETLRLVISDQAGMPYLTDTDKADGGLPGLAVELVQLAAQACDITLKIDRLPSLRSLQALRNGTEDAMLLLSYNPERAVYAHYPLRDGQPDGRYRLATLSYSFFVQRGSGISWDGKQLLGYDGKVGTDLGWSVVRDLAQLGIPVENAVGVETNLAKLRKGRIRVYAAQNILVDTYLKNSDDIVALSPPIATRDYFLPFNRLYAQYHPQVVHCLWQQIASQREPLYRQRARAYGL